MKNHPASPLPPTGFLRLPEVLKLIPLSKTTFWEYVRRGKFPKPIKLSERASAWLASDIQKLIEDLSNPTQGKSKSEANTENA